MVTNPAETPAESSAAAYYTSCRTRGDEASTRDFIASMLPVIDAVETADDLARLLGQLGRIRVAPLFAVEMQSFTEVEDAITLRLAASGTAGARGTTSGDAGSASPDHRRPSRASRSRGRGRARG